MYLQKIKIKNFGVYNGENIISFDFENNSKNIYLIDGNNGYGKTTLHNAIYYCLYGVKEKYKERMHYMNEYALSNGDMNTIVEILFIHNGKHYQMTRSLSASRFPIQSINDIDEEVTMLENGEPIKNIENRINEILPKDASQFFFFDGEDIKKYASLDNTEATREAIEMVLGIPAIRNALMDLESILIDLRKKRRKEMEKSKDQKELIEREEEIIREIDNRKEKIDEAKRKKKNLLDIKEELFEKLEEQKTLRPIINKKRELEEEKTKLEEKLERLRKDGKDMYKNLSYILLKPLIIKYHKEIEEKLKQRQNLEEEAAMARAMIKEIDKILKSKVCICGNAIGKTDEKILLKKQKVYKEKLKKLGDVSTQNLMEKYRKLNDVLRIIDKTEVDYKTLLDREKELLFEIDEITSELKSLEKKLRATISQEGYEKLEKEYMEVEIKLTKLDTDIKWAEEQLKSLRNEHDKIQHQILELKIKSPNLEKLNNKINLIERSIKALNSYLEKIIEIKRQRIEKEATEVFKKLTNKKGVFVGVKINDDYTIRIVDKDGKLVDIDKISAGEKQILALSFIAGLRRSTDKEAPVIMDTPFGRLDHEHKVNVMKFLHRLADQIILLATDEDVNEDNIDIIQPYIAKKYAIQFQPDKKSSRLIEVK